MLLNIMEVDKDNILDAIDWFEHTIVNNDFPSDGLVIIYDDIAYGESLGRTAKFPRKLWHSNGQMKPQKLH